MSNLHLLKIRISEKNVIFLIWTLENFDKEPESSYFVFSDWRNFSQNW